MWLEKIFSKKKEISFQSLSLDIAQIDYLSVYQQEATVTDVLMKNGSHKRYAIKYNRLTTDIDTYEVWNT